MLCERYFLKVTLLCDSKPQVAPVVHTFIISPTVLMIKYMLLSETVHNIPKYLHLSLKGYLLEGG